MSLNTLKILVDDLRWQLTFSPDTIDFDYLMETVKQAKEAQDKELGRNEVRLEENNQSE
jgi:hypothetical protein